MEPLVMTYSYEFSCRKCSGRYPGCHAECEIYKHERVEYDKRKAEFDKYREATIYSHNAIASTLDAEAKMRKNHRGYKYFRR